MPPFDGFTFGLFGLFMIAACIASLRVLSAYVDYAIRRHDLVCESKRYQLASRKPAPTAEAVVVTGTPGDERRAAA